MKFDKFIITDFQMQMRFDGNIGFAGGLLDKPGESVVEGLNRELEEEFALDLSKYAFDQNEHIVSHVNKKKEMVTHFYAKEVSKDTFAEIEKNVLNAEDYGTEVCYSFVKSLSILYTVVFVQRIASKVQIYRNST